jgi:alcohol dehydrogenase
MTTDVREFWYLPMDVVRYGPGSLAQLPFEVERVGAKRPFVITGRSIASQSDILDRVHDLLGSALAAVFTGVQQHAPYASVQRALDGARAANADLLISIGGGSAIDTARAVALAIGERFSSVEQLEGLRARFEPPDHTTIPQTSGRALPHVAVPTTLSAAEFADAAAVTSETRRVKDLFIANELTPRSVILDSEVAVHTPIDLWSATGMRALDHAIETVYSPRGGPVTEVLSLDAIRRLSSALRAAKRDPASTAARGEGQVGAWMSYFGERNLTLGLSHAIGHQLGPQHGVQHGITSCIILPQVMRFLAPATAMQQAKVATALGVDTHGMSFDQAAAAAADAVEALVRDLGLPSRLSQVGVPPSAYPDLARAVLQDLVVAGSPIRISGPEQVMSILERAG